MKINLTEKFRITVAFILILLAAAYSYWFDLYCMPGKDSQIDTAYRGIIKVRDIPLKTLKGNSYTVVKTILDEFCSLAEGITCEFLPLSTVTAEETAALAAKGNSTDIMRFTVGSYKIDESLLLSCENTQNFFSEMILPSLLGKCSYSKYGRLIVPYACDIFVLAVNRDILNEFSMEIPQDYCQPDEFAVFLERLTLAASDKEYTIIASCDKEDKSFAPFSYCGGNKDYYKKIIGYKNKAFSGKEEALYEFTNGKIAVLCLRLSDVNLLKRIALRTNEEPAYEIIMFPCEEKTVFADSLIEYAFFSQSVNTNKVATLKKLALYFLSSGAQQYTDNIGLMPCGKEKVIFSETYLANIYEYYQEAEIIFL